MLERTKGPKSLLLGTFDSWTEEDGSTIIGIRVGAREAGSGIPSAINSSDLTLLVMKHNSFTKTPGMVSYSMTMLITSLSCRPLLPYKPFATDVTQ